MLCAFGLSWEARRVFGATSKATKGCSCQVSRSLISFWEFLLVELWRVWFWRCVFVDLVENPVRSVVGQGCAIPARIH